MQAEFLYYVLNRFKISAKVIHFSACVIRNILVYVGNSKEDMY